MKKIWAEIDAYDGKELTLFSSKSKWKYKVLPGEINPLDHLVLQARMKERGKWGILGIAYFEAVSEKVLTLVRIGLD